MASPKIIYWATVCHKTSQYVFSEVVEMILSPEVVEIRDGYFVTVLGDVHINWLNASGQGRMRGTKSSTYKNWNEAASWLTVEAKLAAYLSSAATEMAVRLGLNQTPF